ncbi:unnamed protein product, partial [Amoebophrya sp. A25]|eukprot:GSA25T00016479001.1
MVYDSDSRSFDIISIRVPLSVFNEWQQKAGTFAVSPGRRGKCRWQIHGKRVFYK